MTDHMGESGEFCIVLKKRGEQYGAGSVTDTQCNGQ